MAATATTRTSDDPSHPNSKMTSPKDSKVNVAAVKTEESAQDKTSDDVKPVTTNGTAAEPLAPPPKPSQKTTSDTPDYFNSNHGTNHFSSEPNPFEQSFGNPSSETPGRGLLPPIANITSPAPLGGVGTPGWGSLRSGPLSPAMLAGPTNQNDYFSESFRGGFPTPNESSLRTGLTPGGGGSMFPAASPNSQAIFNLQSGGATPNTLDFHRTALNAAAVNNGKSFTLNGNQQTSQPTESSNQPQMHNNFQNGQQSQQQAQRGQDPYGNHDVTGAANDLLQFASQANTNGVRNNQFAVPNQPNHLQNQQMQPGADTSQIHRRNTKGSIASMSGVSGATDDNSESGQSEQTKPSTRSRGKNAGKKNAGNKRGSTTDTSVKTPASKKVKGMPKEEEEPSDEEMHDDDDGEQFNQDGKKMTDEEKRKNFLERNRVAALKCRQRKKQWLANLQQKVELFSTENDALSAQVTQLREEVVNLKTLLLAHKECPVSQAQGLGGMAMNSFIGDVHQHANPYGLQGMPNGMMMSAQR